MLDFIYHYTLFMLPFCKQKFSNLYSSQKPLLVYSQPLLLIPLIHYLRNPSIRERQQHSSMFSPKSDVVHISAPTLWDQHL